MEKSPLQNWRPCTEERVMLRRPSWMFTFQGHSPPWRMYSMCTVVVYFNSPQTVYMLECSHFPLHCLGVWPPILLRLRCFQLLCFYWCVTLTLWLFLGKRDPEVSWSNRWGKPTSVRLLPQCWRNHFCLVILCRVPLCSVLRLTFGSTNILPCLEWNTAREAWILSLNILKSFQAQNK